MPLREPPAKFVISAFSLLILMSNVDTLSSTPISAKRFMGVISISPSLVLVRVTFSSSSLSLAAEAVIGAVNENPKFVLAGTHEATISIAATPAMIFFLICFFLLQECS